MDLTIDARRVVYMYRPSFILQPHPLTTSYRKKSEYHRLALTPHDFNHESIRKQANKIDFPPNLRAVKRR